MACMAPFTCKLYIPTDRYGVAKKEIRGSKALIEESLNISVHVFRGSRESANKLNSVDF